MNIALFLYTSIQYIYTNLQGRQVAAKFNAPSNKIFNDKK